jgi:hypothetical protein
VAKQKYELETIIGMSVLYHRRRQSWYERWDMAAKVLALIASAAVVWAEKTIEARGWTFWIALAAGAVTMWVVVTGASRKAVLHSTLAARFVDLEIECIKAGEHDEATLQGIEQKISILKREELPEMGSLVRLCQAEVMRARGYPEHEIPDVPRWHRWWCHMWDFQTPPKNPA